MFIIHWHKYLLTYLLTYIHTYNHAHKDNIYKNITYNVDTQYTILQVLIATLTCLHGDSHCFVNRGE